MGRLSSAQERVQAALRVQGVRAEVRELRKSTRTAQEAARAVGVSVDQIVKSLVFVAGDEPVLVCASGRNRVSLEKLSRLVGRSARQATADEVKEVTGFAVGGVPPVGHVRPLRTLIDHELLKHEKIFAAAGTPHAVFLTTPEALLAMTGGEPVELAE